MLLLSKEVFMKNYVKLNKNLNHLSLGNLFDMIKNTSINKSGAIQTEIFCLIFNIDNISDTTVGNYCTGYRAIGNNYKQIYINFKKHYERDIHVLIPIINNLISVMESTIYDTESIDTINSNKSLIKLCKSLTPLVKNDLYVPINLKKELLFHVSNSNYYDFICQVLFFVILEKKQPLYESDLVNETIEEILEHTNMSVSDLKDFLEIKFKEGISYINSLKRLAQNNNPYANHELGNMEYNGEIAGYPRYEEAYKYYKVAADYSHPTSCWMLAHMIINKKIGSLSNDDIDVAWDYLKKAESLNSLSALNTIGLCYLNGYTKNRKKDLDKAISYFKKAAKENYIYAYNNLGKIYEDKKDYQTAIKYYTKSADSEDSYACNKMGMFYYEGIHIKKDIEKAFAYFITGANAPIKNRIEWNIYNLVNLFYLKGNSNLGIQKDIPKCINLLETISDFEPTYELFLYCYYELYLDNKKEEDLNNVNYYLNILNNTLDKNQKLTIENNLKKIHSYKINIQL